MIKNLFVIGNAESRKGFDLNKLRPHGKIYGCNALYRDFMPDALIAVDMAMIHMVYHTGVATKIPCYFRNWTKVPAFHYKTMVEGIVNHEDLKNLRSKRLIVENERNGAEEFVINGANVQGLVKILKNGKPKGKKNVNQTSVRISWVQPGDKSKSIIEIMGRDKGWASGATSADIGIKIEKPTRVFLIGHDLYSTTKTVNNLYKGTKGYLLPQKGPVPPKNWIKQWREIFKNNKHIKFFKVNSNLEGKDPVNRPIPEWNDRSNVRYIDYTTLDKMLK